MTTSLPLRCNWETKLLISREKILSLARCLLFKSLCSTVIQKFIRVSLSISGIFLNNPSYSTVVCFLPHLPQYTFPLLFLSLCFWNLNPILFRIFFTNSLHCHESRKSYINKRLPIVNLWLCSHHDAGLWLRNWLIRENLGQKKIFPLTNAWHQ